LLLLFKKKQQEGRARGRRSNKNDDDDHEDLIDIIAGCVISFQPTYFSGGSITSQFTRKGLHPKLSFNRKRWTRRMM
jgi:hypothetical protein